MRPFAFSPTIAPANEQDFYAQELTPAGAFALDVLVAKGQLPKAKRGG